MTDRHPVLEALADLLRELEDRGAVTREGRTSNGRWSVDYSASAWTLDDALDAGPGPDSGPGSGPGPGRRRRPEQPGGGDGADGPDDPADSVVTTRETEDGVVVVADVPGIGEDDLTVDLDRDAGTLTFAVDGEELDAVPLSDGDWAVADVGFNNGILEVTLHHD